MIIEVTRDKQTISINRDFASAVSEFAEVLNDERLGVNAMAYVIYFLDPADNNIWFNLPKEIRKKELLESLNIDAAILKDKKIIAATAKYKTFCEENIYYRIKASYNEKLKQIADFMDSTKSVKIENIESLVDVMTDLPKLMKGKEEMEKLGMKEASKASVRGKKTLTLNEQMAN